MDVNIEDNEMAMAFLNGLPSQYDALISALDAIGTENSTFTFDHIKARVLQEEQSIGIRIQLAMDKSSSNAFVTQTSNSRPFCSHCK